MSHHTNNVTTEKCQRSTIMCHRKTAVNHVVAAKGAVRVLHTTHAQPSSTHWYLIHSTLPKAKYK